MVTIFLSACAGTNLLLCGVLFFKKYRYSTLLPAVILAISFPAQGYFAHRAFFVPFEPAMQFSRIAGFFMAISCAALVEFSAHFLRNDRSFFRFPIGRSQVSILWISRCAGGTIAAAFLSSSWLAAAVSRETVVYILSPWGIALFCALFAFILFMLYTLENTLRFAFPYQRRIGRLTFISLAVIGGFTLLFLVQSLLFRAIIRTYVETHIIACGISFPCALSGLVIYSLQAEHIRISRQTLYSSLSLVVIGAALCAVGITFYFMRLVGLSSDFFSVFLALFSAAFFAVLAIGSREMRGRIAHFVNRHVYVRKYDYRDQFFKLHKTYMTGDDVTVSINNLLDNLISTVALEKAYVYLRGPGDGAFCLHAGPDAGYAAVTRISGDDPLIVHFEHDIEPFDFSAPLMPDEKSAVALRLKPRAAELGVTAIFPIENKAALSGLLALRCAAGKRLDYEDTRLIRIFANSIANVLFRERLLRERIENKQFESFSHISSFIAHDIKNQVATLSLLAKNAQVNIANPQFQQSLVRSVKSCADNLSALVAKLSSPRRHGEISPVEIDINEAAAEAVRISGIADQGTVAFSQILKAQCRATADRDHVVFIINNLIRNALEAVNGTGEIALFTGDTHVPGFPLKDTFNMPDAVLRNYRVYCIVKDNGQGMSELFMRDKLFRPFATTKDMGIGIGLYQCKTILEKMGGAIYCHSRQGQGAAFCVFL